MAFWKSFEYSYLRKVIFSLIYKKTLGDDCVRMKKKIGPNYNKYGWMFVSFAFILYLIFGIYPAIDSIILSFQSFNKGVYEFVGFDNFKRMFGDKIFIKSLINTFIFMIIQVPVMLSLALFLASLLNNKTLKGRGFFRTSIFLPCVTALVAYSVLFKMMFSIDGIINKALIAVGIFDEAFQWLQNPFWAKVIIIIAMTWRWTGYNVIFYISALQNIPVETFEAAKVDGATSFQIFRKITVPQLKPIILLTTIMSTNGTLQLFDEIMNITQGGPVNSTMTISQYIYNQSFVYAPNFGYASALSYIIVFFMIILALIQFQIAGKND